MNLLINIFLSSTVQLDFPIPKHISYKTVDIIRAIITLVLVISFVTFFLIMSSKEIRKICPDGKNTALGGKYKRNFWTMKNDILIILIWSVLIPINAFLKAFSDSIYSKLGNMED